MLSGVVKLSFVIELIRKGIGKDTQLGALCLEFIVTDPPSKWLVAWIQRPPTWDRRVMGTSHENKMCLELFK
jgi:hypothetical protein